MCAAAKTVIELFIGYDAEGGGFLVVEGTAGFVLVPGFFQRYTSVNYVDDISAVEQIVDKPLWDESSHGQILPAWGVTWVVLCKVVIPE